jgi:transcription antitermination factor NusG
MPTRRVIHRPDRVIQDAQQPRALSYSAMSDWEEDREPVVGETVLVADGEGQPFEAKIERIDSDGTIVLTVLAFAA